MVGVTNGGEGTEPVREGGSGGDQAQPGGAGDPEGQIAPEPDYVWPTFENIEGVLYQLAAGLFGSPERAFPSFQIENRPLLESALALPHQPYYETFSEKLAALVRSIACNHALVDGNKRLAVTILHSTLLLNARVWLWSDADAAAAMLRAARGDSDFRWLAEFVDYFSLEVPSLVAFTARTPLDESMNVINVVRASVWDEGIPREIERRVSQSVLKLITPEQLAANFRAAITAMATGTENAAPPAVRLHLPDKRE